MDGRSIILSSYKITSPTWFPTVVPITGTIATTDVKVTGIGTQFITDGVSAGDWLIDTNGNVARQIFSVVSQTELELSAAFPANLPGATVVRVRDKAIKYLNVVFLNAGGSIKGAHQSSGAEWPALIPWTSQPFDDFIEPILVTPGGSGACVIMGQ